MPIPIPEVAAAVLLVDAADDVATAVQPLARGTVVSAGGRIVVLGEDIAAGHKVALRTIAQGDTVRKFGAPIGVATAAIGTGCGVHTHNLATRLSGDEAPTGGRVAYAFDRAVVDPPAATFLGYRRPDGRVGTRNEVWILCTVGCVARTAQKIAARAAELYDDRVDGIHAYTHPHGCSQLGDDLADTRRVLAAMAAHPNAGGVLLVGLGCESNALDTLLADVPAERRERLRWFSAQGVEDEVAAGIAAVAELVASMSEDVRVPCALGDLTIGLKCGGSDGLSGLTANPLVGRVADRCVAAGGTAILTEIPEAFGAEQVLYARAATPAVQAELAALFAEFRRYYLDRGLPVHENPSPGNIAGGITTLEEKSLGAVQKGGRSPVTDVVRYGGRARISGLTLLEAPGNDAVSSTALVAAGATVILFTTGRGTPLGFPAPTLKIASNSPLARRKPGWIDFDAGTLLDGEAPDVAAARLFELLVETASGRRTCSERNGEREIALWKRGVTL